MQFSRKLRDRVISGRITVSFRLWQRPKVQAGGNYRVGYVQIKIDALDVMPFAAVTADDVRRSGEDDRETLRRRPPTPGRSMTTPSCIEWNSTSSIALLPDESCIHCGAARDGL